MINPDSGLTPEQEERIFSALTYSLAAIAGTLAVLVIGAQLLRRVF